MTLIASFAHSILSSRLRRKGLRLDMALGRGKILDRIGLLVIINRNIKFVLVFQPKLCWCMCNNEL